MRLRTSVAFAAGVVMLGALRTGNVYGAAVDPCSLLTSAQVASALGVPDVKASGGNTRCSWVPTKYAPGSKSVTLQMTSAVSFAASRSGPSIPGRREVTPVNGIGDQAVQSTTPVNTIVAVKKGNLYFDLAVHLPGDQGKAAAQSLAKQVASKL
jgi:hypothetical protein